jgi:hypothetical protein
VETIRQFAEKHKTRLNDRRHERKYRLETSEDTINGRYGEIVEDVTFGKFVVKFIAVPRNAVMTGALRNRYRQALDGGLVLKRKCGDAESTFHFDPTDEAQSRLALSLVGAKTRRTVSLTPEQRIAIGERLRKAKEASTMAVAA